MILRLALAAVRASVPTLAEVAHRALVPAAQPQFRVVTPVAIRKSSTALANPRV